MGRNYANGVFICRRASASSSHILRIITENSTKEKQKRFRTNKIYNKMDFVFAADAGITALRLLLLLTTLQLYLFRYKLLIIIVSIYS